MIVPDRFAVAMQSPIHVAAKNRDAWVNLFAADGFIEDPVEAGRYVGHEQLGAFWDVFIGPQPSISFDVKRDFCGGSTLIRQATVVTVTEADASANLEVPTLMRYDIRDGEVASLRVIWEPRAVVGWFLRRGGAGFGVLGKQTTRMMSKAGLQKAMSFTGTLATGISKSDARTLVDVVCRRERQGWIEHFGRASITVEHGEDVSQHVRDATAALDRLQAHVGTASRLEVDQLLTCGNHVGAFLRDADNRSLAVMIRSDGRGAAESLCAIWSPDPVVLTAAEPTPRAANA